MSKEMEELQELCMPLIKYLRKNHHPHTTLTITDDKIQLDESLIGIPVPYEEEE